VTFLRAGDETDTRVSQVGEFILSFVRPCMDNKQKAANFFAACLFEIG